PRWLYALAKSAPAVEHKRRLRHGGSGASLEIATGPHRASARAGRGVLVDRVDGSAGPAASAQMSQADKSQESHGTHEMVMRQPSSKPGLLTLTIKDKSALYLAYMPFVKNGGPFTPPPA